MRMLDLTDRLVYEMADNNHIPTEIRAHRGYAGFTTRVECEFCGEPWPCQTRDAIRKIQKELRQP